MQATQQPSETHGWRRRQMRLACQRLPTCEIASSLAPRPQGVGMASSLYLLASTCRVPREYRRLCRAAAASLTGEGGRESDRSSAQPPPDAAQRQDSNREALALASAAAGTDGQPNESYLRYPNLTQEGM
eukprot:960724-Pleurochrysis_carterae.AAC.2